ncbi:hypothetical protein BD410DRAFT_447166 [Rickenella mellea]|uniref:Uncharacterized protein n=1 Tax=Rickenella mellea TaxID=50990 RepID=A0A4Y7PXA6_9AGAM|nr:hypothetical protein BD410DRAFT_447166 [Rickenella mellea]
MNKPGWKSILGTTNSSQCRQRRRSTLLLPHRLPAQVRALRSLVGWKRRKRATSTRRNIVQKRSIQSMSRRGIGMDWLGFCGVGPVMNARASASSEADKLTFARKKRPEVSWWTTEALPGW